MKFIGNVSRFPAATQGAENEGIVHGFTRYDIVEDAAIASRYKATEEKIKEWKGEIIAGTEEEIEVEKLDSYGRYLPTL